MLRQPGERSLKLRVDGRECYLIKYTIITILFCSNSKSRSLLTLVHRGPFTAHVHHVRRRFNLRVFADEVIASGQCLERIFVARSAAARSLDGSFMGQSGK